MSQLSKLPSLEALKAQAKRLRLTLAAQNTPVSQSAALETLAHQWGFRDWNTLSAAAKSSTLPTWQVGQAVVGEYLKHSFKGSLKAARQAQDGFWYLTVVFEQAIDVVDSDAFSSFRKQVNVVLNSDAITPSKLSDGTPHMRLWSQEA